MEVKEMMENLPIIIENKDEEELDKLLCEAVIYILDNHWKFLIEVLFDLEADPPFEMRQGKLVIGYEKEENGFCKMRLLSIGAILSKDLKEEDVSFDEKAAYLEKLLPIIPWQERKRRKK